MRNAIFRIVCLVLVCVSVVAQQHCGLDLTFASKGWRFTPVASFENRASRLEIQMDGKILAVGAGKTDKQFDFAIARHNIDGSMDLSWGKNGIVLTDFDNTWDIADDAEVTKDGKILVAGSTGTEYHRRLAICRFLSNGSLDTSFGINGKISFNHLYVKSPQIFKAVEMKLTSLNQIVIVGTFRDSLHGYNDFAIVRLTPEGLLDQTWGSSGVVFTDYGHTIGSCALEIQEDGKIIAGGNAYKGSNPEVNFSYFGRYLNNGQLDHSFGQGGMAFVSEIRVRDIALQDDGKIVGVGESMDGRTCCAACRLTSSGSLDFTFNNTGIQKTCIGDMSNVANAVTIQPNKGILVAGLKLAPGIAFDFALIRYNSDGSLDDNCLQGGKETFDFPDNNIHNNNGHYPVDIKLQTDGKPVFLGFAFNFFDKFVLARYTVDNTVEIKEHPYNSAFNSVYSSSEQAILVSGPAAEIYVVDLTGRCLYQGTKENATLIIDVKSFATGIYAVTINDGYEVSSRKIAVGH